MHLADDGVARDAAEFGFSQLRLVLCFLRWNNLKENRGERIDSPLLLLPGPARVFHGTQFVGETALETVAAGEEFELQLGVDDQIRVERKLRRRGTAIYPVACSGYKDDAELVLRALAMVTGSQFLFLTDDSGVGDSHAEPHIPFYHVQKLDQLMIRMITSELSGQHIAPERAQILRTVGKPIN